MQKNFKNVAQILAFAFEESSRQFIGYSNTAAIMRLGEQRGASASTAPDDLTMQEAKAQAVWILKAADSALNDLEMALITLKYGKSSPVVVGAGQLVAREYMNYPDYTAELLLSNALEHDFTGRKWNHGSEEKEDWRNYPAKTHIAVVTGKHRKTIAKWADEIKTDIDKLMFASELILEQEFQHRGLIETEEVELID